MNVLVTGGGGFLGQYIVQNLVARGDKVRVLGRGDYPQLERLNVECLQGDIRQAETVANACHEIETVFHTAAVSGIWGSFSHFHGINTVGTENVVAACRQAGVRRLVYTSSQSLQCR
jgi:nucleoside-diphosphate-sugar epimerase